MSEAIATVIVQSMGIYLVLGVFFGLAFVAVGVGRIDPVARGGSFGFRALIFPGAVALWPLLAWRWIAANGAPPAERNAHRDAASAARNESVGATATSSAASDRQSRRP